MTALSYADANTVSEVVQIVDEFCNKPHPMAIVNNDDVWNKTENHLIRALCLYLYETETPENRTLEKAYRLLCAMVKDPEFGMRFKELSLKKPDSAAVTEFNLFLKTGSHLIKSFTITAAKRICDSSNET